MSLSEGDRLGPYEVAGRIGVGGMGEVYRARDTRLHRDVALKVLPSELSEDSDRRSRFEQEARSASALNHPNIVTVYDIGESGSTVYIAMELVEGRTVRELLAEGSFPVRRMLSIGAQAADGLARAHSAGIVHRDLKPENLMVTKEGFVKILDFGLAKLVAPVSEDGSNLATLAGPATQPGVVLGTVGYMSPEQASGRAADFRSDQFSFGAILYEMATGKRAFSRGTPVETLSAIIREDPEPIARANPAAPAPVRWIVESCLQKDPEERYASTRDLARDLKQAQEHLSELSGESAAIPTRPRARKAPWTPVLLGLVALLVGADVLMRMRAPSGGALSSKLRKVTFGPGLEDEPAWSPDAKLLAYTTDERGNLDVVVQPIAGGEPLKIAATDADEAQAAWSPDGSKLAFVSARDRGGRLSGVLGQATLANFVGGVGGDLFVVPALGGTPAKLVESGAFPAWSPDGKKIVFSSARGGQWDLWVVPSDGGSPTRLTNDSEFDYHPSWSPDGKWIAYGSGTLIRFGLRTVAAGGGAPQRIEAGCNLVVGPTWSADGKSLVFSGERDGLINLWRMPMSGAAGTGPPERVSVGAGADVNAAFARDGRIALATLGGTTDIWEWSLSSRELRQVTSETGSETFPRVSPDGKTLLFRSDRSGAWAVWAMDLSGWSVTRVTSGVGETAGGARWSLDGRQIIFEREDGIWIQPLGGVGARNLGLKGINSAWSPDGARIAYAAQGRDLAHHEIAVVPAAGGTPRQLTRAGGNALWPAWSSDGKWIAYQLDHEGERYVWIVPSSGGEARRITSGPSEESHPEWVPGDPDRLLFLRNHSRLFLTSISTGKETPIELSSATGRGPSSPMPLLGSVILDYPCWSPDGSRIFFSVTRKTGDLYVLGGD